MSHTDRVAQLFRSKRRQWVNAETLMAVGGRLGWRTRVSECRTVLGLRVTNRMRVVKRGSRRFTVSEYRLH